MSRSNILLALALVGLAVGLTTATITPCGDVSEDDYPPVLNIKTFFLFAHNEDVQPIVQMLNSRGSHQHYVNIRLIRSMYCFGRKTEIRIETDDTQFFNSQACWPSRPEIAWVSNAIQQAYISKLLWIRFQSYSQTPLADALHSGDDPVASHCLSQDDDNKV